MHTEPVAMVVVVETTRATSDHAIANIRLLPGIDRLSRVDRSRLLDAKLCGYLDSSNRSGTMAAAWAEYCRENRRPEITILCRPRGSCEVSLRQPMEWEHGVQRTFQASDKQRNCIMSRYVCSGCPYC